MRLLRAEEVPQTDRDQVFCASRLHAVLFVLLSVGACAAILFYGWPSRKASYYVAGAIVLLLLALRRFVTARLHPQNWLVRKGDEGLFLHIRSYLNERLSPNDPTVIFLAYSEIHSARLVREHLEVRDMQNKTETQIITWIELELAVDPAPIAAALSTESGRSGIPEKRWYGTSTTLYRDYPVQMERPPFLRIKWQVTPRAGVFLESLRDRVNIAPKVVISVDLAHLQTLPAEEQQKRLQELIRRGQTIPAVYMAQKIHGCSLTEAKHLIDSLQEKS